MPSPLTRLRPNRSRPTHRAQAEPGRAPSSRPTAAPSPGSAPDAGAAAQAFPSLAPTGPGGEGERRGVLGALQRARAAIPERLGELLGRDQPTAPQSPARFWFRGFEAQKQELTLDRVPAELIEGELPAALRGTFYRSGPGQYEVNGDASTHFYDGDGMVAAWHFGDDGVSFRNRFVRTKGFEREQAMGERKAVGFGTRVPGGALMNIGRPFKNMANTNLMRAGDKIFALYEGGKPYALDPQTLETLGEWDFDGVIPRSSAFSAHPKVDESGIYNFGMQMGPRPKMNFFRIDHDGQAEKLGSLRPSRMVSPHDFAMTENHLVVPAIPYEVSPLKMARVAAGVGTLSEVFRWRPEHPTSIYVVDKAGKTLPRRIDTESEFAVHIANAFERDGDIIVDYVAYEDATAYAVLDEILQRPPERMPPSSLRRMTISPDGTVQRRTLANINGEFPRINDTLAGKPHRYVYGLELDDSTMLGHRLWKVDADSGQVRHCDFGPDVFVGEPVFVPDPDGKTEDDGWLLVTLYDEKKHQSSLAVVPAAQGFESGPVARIHLPIHLPVQFHSTFTAS